MTKQEMELSQCFTELEITLKKLRMAHDVSKSLGSQAHKYWDGWIVPVEKSLETFKTNSNKILLETDEPIE